MMKRVLPYFHTGHIKLRMVIKLKVLSLLVERGIFVRMPGVAPMDRCIRVSAGTDEDLNAFANEFPGALKDAAASG